MSVVELLKNDNNFLYLATLLLLVLVGYILRTPKGQKPSGLNMYGFRRIDENAGKIARHEELLEDKKFGKSRDLSCNFLFEGKSYNAYEVLNIPAGCSENVVRLAYERLKENKKLTISEQNLVKLAFKLLLNSTIK